MAVLVSDWPIFYRLVLHNYRMWSQETCQKSSSRSSRSSVVFQRKFQYGRSSLWWAEKFFTLFSKTSSIEVTKLAIDVPLGVPKKCCLFLEWFKIQDGHIDLWLVEAFLTCFPRNVSFGGPRSFSNEDDIISAVSLYRINYKFIWCWFSFDSTWVMNKGMLL